MEIEFDTKYRSGKRTFVYLFLRYGWLFLIPAVVLLYVAYEMYFGQWQAGAAQFFNAHPTWYITAGMVTEWLAFGGVALLLIAYMRASVLYRAYSFHVDQHALHLRRGLIRVQEITIPYRQISNIHIEQPYHWRFLGLAELDITIASSRESLSKVMRKQDFLIPCIDKSVARALSHFLVHQASGEDDETDDALEEEDDSEDISIES
jgi:uncharacterized membrane protein YdbT with pleckstrin-like domain